MRLACDSMSGDADDVIGSVMEGVLESVDDLFPFTNRDPFKSAGRAL